MYDFSYYHKPSSVADAVKLLAPTGARAISGGQPCSGAQAPLNKPHLAGVTCRASRRAAGVTRERTIIGALTKPHRGAESAEIKPPSRALAYSPRHRRHPGPQPRHHRRQRRQQRPGGRLPLRRAGPRRTVVTTRRTIAADEFFQGMFTTALGRRRAADGVEFPIPEKAGYAKMRNPASRYVMAGVFISKGPQGIRVAVNGAAPCVFRQAAMEAALAGNWSADAVAAIRQDASGLNGDIHGSAEYRAHLVTVMAKRAMAMAG
jgi:carbon-monoxide dehydrogenase medium subunit